MIPLAIPTADNTVISVDTIDFTADGSCLVNGGATDIREAPPGKSFNALGYTVAGLVRF